MSIKQIKTDLASKDEKKILKAIKSSKTNGDKSLIRPMIELYKLEMDAVSREVTELLSSLKDSTVTDEIIAILNDDDFIDQRQIVLSTIWNAPVDYSYYLAEFVAIAVDGSFLEALECLTIMENMTGPFEERHVLESQLHLKEYLEDETPKDPKKAQIMSEIALFIKDVDRNLQD